VSISVPLKVYSSEEGQKVLIAVKRRYQASALFLLGLFFALALSSANVKSATTDEGYHLATGYSYLKSLIPDGSAFADQPYPHLAGAWAALPLLLERPAFSPPAAPDANSPRNFWDYVFDLFDLYYHSPNILRYTFVGRAQIMLLGVVLGALVFHWASKAFGPRAGLLACFLYVFSPNVLAHGRLITTDLASALACLVTMYLTQRLLRRVTIWRAVAVGLALGGALLVKYSTLLLAPAIGILLLLAGWDRDQKWTLWPTLARRAAALRAAGTSFLIFAVAGLVVWVAFGFEFGSPERVNLSFSIPAPSYVDEIVYHSLEQRPAFLFGQRWVGGRWSYFPATLLFKTPPPMLFLFLVTLLVVIFRRRLGEQLPLWVFPAVYFCVSLSRGFNIGHRHLLPVLPFAFVFVGQAVSEVFDRSRWIKVGGILLAGWYLGASLWIYPDYLAYFNLFAGGPSRGYRVLVDSNLEWGQDLIQLRDYMEREQIDEVRLSWFSDADPALYGVRYRALPNWTNRGIAPDFYYLQPDPGVYVVSPTFLQRMYLPNPSTFDWFAHRRPVDQIGYSMLVYRVPEDVTNPNWVGMCDTPATSLSPDEMAAGFGRVDLRVIYFECRTSGVISQEDLPGWYVVPASLQNSDNFITFWLDEASLEFEQYDQRDELLFSIYRLDEMPPLLQETPVPVGVIQAGARPGAQADDAPRFSPPLDVNGPATFLGYQLGSETITPGEVFNVRTFWQARRTVTETMPSIFVHLLDGEGQAWSVGDALDFAAIQWQAGDIFVQQHRMEIPADVPPGSYWIASGLYDLNTGVRYPVLGVETQGDTFLFDPVEVE
jgi:hypothetical protein